MDKKPPKPPLSLLPKDNLHQLQPKSHQEPDPEVIQYFERCLEMAKSGEMCAMACAGVTELGVIHYWGGAMSRFEMLALTGAVAAMQHEMTCSIAHDGELYEPPPNDPQRSESEDPLPPPA